VALANLAFSSAHAKKIGEIQPALSLTAQRIAALPVGQAAPWANYLTRSLAAMAQDMDTLAQERAALQDIASPPEGSASEKSMPLDFDASWYASAPALAVAANILSLQTPSGGWGKNQARNTAPRRPGQAYVTSNRSKYLTSGDFDTPENGNWSYVGTIDNDATITEIRFLAKVIYALSPDQSGAYRDSAVKGLRYLLAAQFPNGGWPQVWPLQGGYHDAYTVNDNAVVAVTDLLIDAASGNENFAFVPDALRQEAKAASQRAIEGLLASQLRIEGQPALWAQQYDALTLEPSSARNFEPAALCSTESATILLFLMRLAQPDAQVVHAVHSGVAMLRRLVIEGNAWRKVSELDGRLLVSAPGAPTLWARYYDVASLQPVFGDRDKSLYDDVADISLERRNGYGWYSTVPNKAMQAYATWSKRHPAQP
jgi:PelA/Pel-15E family pectate lyase